MEAWRRVWRHGFSPLLPLLGLQRLKTALETDDPRLLQGATCTPPPLTAVLDWPVEACDCIVFAFWADHDFHCTAEDGEEFFAQRCFECDTILGEPAASRWFLNWYDETPRNEVFRALALEVGLEVTKRLRKALCTLLCVAEAIPDEALKDLAQENGHEGALQGIF